MTVIHKYSSNYEVLVVDTKCGDFIDYKKCARYWSNVTCPKCLEILKEESIVKKQNKETREKKKALWKWVYSHSKVGRSTLN